MTTISPIPTSSSTVTKTTAQERINNANTLSVTPEFQGDLAVITNLNGVDQGPTQPDFESLIYNAASVLSGTSGAGLLTGTNEQEQIKKLTDAYSKN